jgi:hypothetical protein
MWDRESRCRPVRPERLARGSVRVVWPYAPHVVGIVTASGEQLTIRVQR